MDVLNSLMNYRTIVAYNDRGFYLQTHDTQRELNGGIVASRMLMTLHGGLSNTSSVICV